jgi:mannose-1-phosphate guanylyltransferase
LSESTRSSPPEGPTWAVILAGGIGSRFWPVSTPARPKQLLPLAGETPLIRQTVERILPLVPADRLRILTGRTLAGPILEAVPFLGPENLLLEPIARGTAPVLAWAAHAIAGRAPDAVMVSLHSDHVIEPADVFVDVLRRAAVLSVRHRRLFTLGATPTRPETGYGYIRPGAPLADSISDPIPSPIPGQSVSPGTAVGAILSASGPYAVERFVEKPDRVTAERCIAEGFLWNTGIFVWPAALLLQEIRHHTPELAMLLPLLDAGDVAGFFDRAPDLTIDVGVLERSDRVAVVRTGFRWDDVGAWDAVGRNRETDSAGNVAHGDASLIDSRDCIAWAEDGSIVMFGTDNLVVVRSGGITFVAPRDRTPDLKDLLARLPDRTRGSP